MLLLEGWVLHASFQVYDRDVPPGVTWIGTSFSEPGLKHFSKVKFILD